jgi:AcrR family transcriptional regulator
VSSNPHDARRRERDARAAHRRELGAARREPRGRGRARRALSAELIVETALRIADEEGVDAVSMRRIAAELRVGTMSLYHHVADKVELLDLMADEISGELLVPGEVLGDWREALRAIARRTRDAFLAHPWLIDTAGQRPLVTPNSLRHVEQSVAVVEGLHVDREAAIAMVMATDDYAIGHVFRRLRIGTGARSDASEDDRRRVRELLATGEFPHLARVLADDADIAPPPDTFDAGLEWLFDGMQAMLEARRG